MQSAARYSNFQHMATAVNMPQVGQDILTAKVLEWHVREGQEVKEGDIIATVESDKASFEVEVFESGTILRLLYNEGDEAEVFKPIAYIGVPGEDLSIVEGIVETKKEATVKEAPAEANTKPEPDKNRKLFASPSARRIASSQVIRSRQE